MILAGTARSQIAKPATAQAFQKKSRYRPASPRVRLQRAPSVALYDRLPISFEPNQGQTNSRAKFLARGPGYTLFLTRSGAVFSFTGRELRKKNTQQGTANRQQPIGLKEIGLWSTHVIRFRLLHANHDVQAIGHDELAGKANYFIGNNPKLWRTNIPTFGRVEYKDIYPGVNLVYYGRQGRLEYDFMVEPGASLKVIRLAVESEALKNRNRKAKIEIAGNGDLVIETSAGEVRFKKPKVYQDLQTGNHGSGGRETTVQSVRKYLSGNFVLLAGNQIGFVVPQYDPHRPLVLDPALSYSTYFGGSTDENAIAGAADAAGDLTITGYTSSINFPLAGTPYQTSLTSAQNAFVAQLNPTGTALKYSTYLGGSGNDQGDGIALDSAGDAYVAITTSSNNFPTTPSAFQSVYQGGLDDSAVTELNSTGSALVYSTFLDGNEGNNYGHALGIALDSSNNAHVTGFTCAPNFPLVAPLRSLSPCSSGGDAYVAELNSTGTGLVYSTGLDTNGGIGVGIAVDSSGGTYVTGYGNLNGTSPFATSGAAQTTPGGSGDSFACKIGPAGASLVYCTIIGGSGADLAHAIAADSSGNAYVVGETQSLNFPIVSSGVSFPAFQSACGNLTSCDNAFITKINATGTAFVYSTYLGGSGKDIAYGVTVDSSGDAYVAGETSSSNFPLASALQATCAICTSGGHLAFVAEMNPTGSALNFSTYLGGSRDGHANGLALDNAGDIDAFGRTSAADFPTLPGAFQSLCAACATGGHNAFIAQIGQGTSAVASLAPASLSFSAPQMIGTTSAAQSVTLRNLSNTALSISSITPSANFAETDNCQAGVTPLAGGSSCTINVTFDPTLVGSLSGALTVNDNAVSSSQSVLLTGNGASGGIVSLAPTSLTFATQVIGAPSTTQTVTLTNIGTGTLGSISISTTNTDFGETNNCATSLAASANCTISVTFTPSVAGTETATLKITDDATNSPQSVALTGTGAQASVSLSPSGSLTFNNQGLNLTSYFSDVKLANSGTSPLLISSIAISGDFAERTDCPLSPLALAPGLQCDILVTFTPTALGPRSGTLTVNSNSSASPQTLSLSGNGVQLSIQPGELVFGGEQALGVASAPQTVTLTNLGTSAAGITSVLTTGDFAETSNCPSSLAAGANCTINVTYAPSTIGKESGTLVVNSSLPEASDTIPLYGFGAVLKMSPEPTNIYFGAVPIGTTSHPRVVTLTNSGSSPVTLTEILATGDFAESNTCGTTLAAGASCAINVTFSPTAPGSTSQTLTITSNAPESPQTVTLRGVGVVLLPYPATLDFGAQGVSVASTPQTVTLTNTFQTGTVTISGITTSSDYAQTNTCTSLAPGAQCSITITFTPSIDGPDNGTLTVSDSAANNPLIYTLTGSGSRLGVSPSSLTFAQGTINTTSAPQPVTLTNVGSAPLILEAIGATGDFAQTNNCPVAPATLAAGAQCVVNVTFTPTLYGSENGELLIDPSDIAGPSAVALQGSGPATTFVNTDVFVGTSGSTIQRLSSSGQLLQEMDTGVQGSATSGMAFDSGGNLFATDFYTGNVSKFDDTGSLLSDFSPVLQGEPESIVFDSSNNAYVGVADGVGAIFKYDDSGNQLAEYFAATEDRGTDWVELGPDECTIYYTSEGQSVKTFNACTNTQMPDFTDSLPGTSAYELRLLPSGGMLVADTEQIVRLDASGNIAQIYTVPGEDTWFALNLDPSGTSFWSAGLFSDVVYKIDIASGAVLERVPVNTAPSLGVSGLLVKGEITVAAGLLTVSPTSLAFPSVHAGLTCSPTTVILTNSGLIPVTISSITSPVNFPETNTCPASLAAGASCTVTVQFSPTATGAQTGTLTITDNTSASPQTVALAGTGLAACALTAATHTATVLRGVSSAQFNITDPSSPSLPSCFISTIHMSCNGQGVLQCMFNPLDMPPGGTTQLTVGNLTALSGDNQNFQAIAQASTSGPDSLRQAGVILGVKIQDIDFGMSPQSATISPGQSATYYAALVPVNGLQGSVSLACTGAPAGASCTVMPSQLTLDGTHVADVQIHVTTGAAPALNLIRDPGSPSSPFALSGLGLWILALPAMLLASYLAWKRRRLLFALAAVVFMATAWAACGTGTASLPTSAGNYTLTLQATYTAPPSGSNAGGTFVKSTTFTLDVR